jgi:hypothetical protein
MTQLSNPVEQCKMLLPHSICCYTLDFISSVCGVRSSVKTFTRVIRFIRENRIPTLNYSFLQESEGKIYFNLGEEVQV